MSFQFGYFGNSFSINISTSKLLLHICGQQSSCRIFEQRKKTHQCIQDKISKDLHLFSERSQDEHLLGIFNSIRSWISMYGAIVEKVKKLECFFFKMQSAYITLTYYFFGSIQTSRNSWKMEVFLQYCWNGVTNETNTRNHKNSGKIA